MADRSLCVKYTAYIHNRTEEEVTEIIKELSKKHTFGASQGEVKSYVPERTLHVQNINDKIFIDTLLRKMANVGLYYLSFKEVGRVVFDDVFTSYIRTPKNAIPSIDMYKKLNEWYASKRLETKFFPPQIYTEILELAGRAKRDDAILVYDYVEPRTKGGVVVLVGCKGSRLTKADEIVKQKQKRYEEVKLSNHQKYNTTIIKYEPGFD